MDKKRDYLSGAQKRKIQQQKVDAAKKLTKLDSFFKKTTSASSEPGDETRSKTEPDSASTEPGTSTQIRTINLPVSNDVSEGQTTISNLPCNDYQEKQNEDTFSQNSLSLQCFETDLGKFSEGSFDVDRKRAILASQPCQPKGPFPKDLITKRSFSAEYYSFRNKAGQKVERFWLCYSPTLNGVYCEPCWLFSECPESHSWRDGKMCDWQGLSKKIKKHESSAAHLQACFVYASWKKNKTIVDQISNEREKWKDIFVRIVDVVRTLAMCSLPFRGHKEDISKIGQPGQPQSGNFLNIIDLLSRYDSLLKAHITSEKSRSKYLHHDFQNQIISLLADSVVKSLLSKINSCPFYSIIVDTTQDLAKVDQMSIVIRHITLSETPTSGNEIKINESFLGFWELRDQSSEGYETQILSTLEKLGIDIEKCRGQGYDGASTMSGQYTGLQQRIKAKVPNAEYVHCASHSMNLVINDSVSHVPEIAQFFDIVQRVYVFFSESLPRWQGLNESVMDDDTIKNLTLKKLCPTRWSSRNNCLIALKNDFKSVMKCLTEIILHDAKKKVRDEALSIRNHLDNFQFILSLTLEGKVLESIDIASKSLQKETVDLNEACRYLNQSSEAMKQLRANFPQFLHDAKKLASTWNISQEIPKKRQHVVKKFYDEIASDWRIEDPVKAFEIKVFNASLDVIVNQLQIRFKGLHTIAERFSFLSPRQLNTLPDEEIRRKARELVQMYPSDLSDALEQQIVSFKELLSKEIVQKTTIKQIASLLIEENICLSSCLPDLTTALQLYLTLPVTVAKAERSFSKLKLIKSYLRSTMSQTRLSDLAVLSIENEETRKIDLYKVVDQFLLLKKRRFGGTM